MSVVNDKGRNKVLVKMLDRLFAGLMNGPSLNCRPHSSRQRIDLAKLSGLQDLSPESALRAILDAGEVKLTARVVPPKDRSPKATRNSKRNGEPAPKGRDHDADTEATASNGQPTLPAEAPGEADLAEAARNAAERAWAEQQALFKKLRIIVDDSRTYEQDTGVHVLQIGFPLLSLPPGSLGADSGTRRVLAPVALIPVSVSVRHGPASTIQIASRGEGIDRVVPNTGLIAWLERQSGKSASDIFADEAGEDPWREIGSLVHYVCDRLQIKVPELFEKIPKRAAPSAASKMGEADAAEEPGPDNPISTADQPREQEAKFQAAELKLLSAPRSEETPDAPTILCSAVLGLFPMANQGLLRDMQAMAAGEPMAGPVKSFVEVGASFDKPAEAIGAMPEKAGARKSPRAFTEERLVTAADPCQARAVRLARNAGGLVVHGPPGTGKSQTITNIIGDHLVRGERVLLVCDKRTALDVVVNRLDHMGLRDLCAIVHDPQRDQRDLYKSIREQLEALPDAATQGKAKSRLAKLDSELQSIHGELTQYHQSLSRRESEHGLNFHELVAQWLALTPPEALAAPEPAAQPAQNGPAKHAARLQDSMALENLTLDELEKHSRQVHDILQRAEAVSFATNPWVDSAGTSLADFLARPMEQVRASMSEAAAASRNADATADPSIPAFAPGSDLRAEGAARGNLAERLQDVLTKVGSTLLAHWAGQSADAMARAIQKLMEAEPFLQTLRAGRPDAELALTAEANPPDAAQIGPRLSALAAYLEVAPKWYAFAAFGKKSAAAAVLNRYGLTLSVSNAERVRTFLTAVRAQIILTDLNRSLFRPGPDAVAATAEDQLLQALEGHRLVLGLLSRVRSEKALQDVARPLAQALAQPTTTGGFIGGLRKSPARADALVKLEDALGLSRLFSAPWLTLVGDPLRVGKSASRHLGELAQRVDTLEGVLRVRQALAELPETLRPAVQQGVMASWGAEEGLNALRRETLAAEIGRRLRADTHLQGIDVKRLESSFKRYRELEAAKKELVRDAILHRWISKQKDRLLATTGSRLNAAGADVRRRLTLRGERAMRLRQVIAVGQATEGGDPLFDLRPVWMASPETVAQVFPRAPIFDVVVFDEASQCRLEEALPVLLRGKRVTIAGDPRQLPPTRFFESAVAVNDDEEIETDQQLFEAQQAETEDLLGAALGLDIQQCYLDVHYRSRNADLIGFSNREFYGSRLQPLPGHPSRRARTAPVKLVRADGVYDKRVNEKEAEQVCQIVRELLDLPESPSIGIACFNLQQRDLIVERLDELAEQDEGFGKKLEAARTRRGEGSFEGLFVKNLENVQGDERDHIIISTTYGPDPKGKFYRRFGPLGRLGGGRRLNVLVTRAREQVHVVTSIPAQAYRSLPPVPAGQSAGGAWLLFSYLHFAETMAQEYARRQAEEASAADAQHEAPAPSVHVHPTQAPSAFAEALAPRLADQFGLGSEVHWGNDGFCVDLAIRDPSRTDGATVGVLCDSSRFAAADDPMEWDVFRSGILEGQGWKLHRVWTPHFFRDPRGCTQALVTQARSAASEARTQSAGRS